MADAHEIAREIARAGDYWKDYPSTPCPNKLASGGHCGQRRFAGRIDVELLASRIAAAIMAERPQWRPIEEAPKDGTEIVLFARGDREYMAVGQWSDNTELPGTVAGWFWPFAIRPTHWQPLPPPPGETP